MRPPVIQYALLFIGSMTAKQCNGLMPSQQMHQNRQTTTKLRQSFIDTNNAITNSDEPHRFLSRRNVLLQTLASTTAAVTTSAVLTGGGVGISPNPAIAADETALAVIKTASGLKYIDLETGTGASPKYGNFCSIAYTGYIKLPKTPDNPNPKPEQFDSTSAYLVKHGNGRMIPGLDEGLHTMKVGGKRRIIIPPKLGYIDLGLGPLPEYPWQRYRLNKLLDDMVAVGAGTIIFEVQLLSVMEDEADQGYYQDDSLTPEEFNTLRENLRIKGLEQRDAAGTT